MNRHFFGWELDQGFAFQLSVFLASKQHGFEDSLKTVARERCCMRFDQNGPPVSKRGHVDLRFFFSILVIFELNSGQSYHGRILKNRSIPYASDRVLMIGVLR